MHITDFNNSYFKPVFVSTIRMCCWPGLYLIQEHEFLTRGKDMIESQFVHYNLTFDHLNIVYLYIIYRYKSNTKIAMAQAVSAHLHFGLDLMYL